MFCVFFLGNWGDWGNDVEFFRFWGGGGGFGGGGWGRDFFLGRFCFFVGDVGFDLDF